MKHKIERTKLDNGLTILTCSISHLQTVTLSFLIKKGSRHEPAELNGITHFIEHLVFKGTKNKNMKQIATELDLLGGDFNAYTSYENLTFLIRTIKNYWKQAFELLAEIITQPTFDKTNIELEKDVINEEIQMMEDNPESLLGELVQSSIFPNHSLGRPITGSKKTIKNFTSEILKNYHACLLKPENLIIAAAGNIKHDELVNFVIEKLKINPSTETKIPVEQNPKMHFPFLVKNRRELNQVHLAFTFPWIKASDPRYHTSIILEKLLGDTYSSRLWQKIREEKGLVYSLGLDVTSFLDCGYLCLTMATAPSNIEKLIKITFQEIKKLKENPFSKAELDIFKRQAEISILLATEDSVGLLENMLNSELIHNKQISTQELISSIKKVTPYHIQELANEFFLSNRAGLICLGKVDKDTLSSLYLDAIESLKS